jgi:hypothetical protein
VLGEQLITKSLPASLTGVRLLWMMLLKEIKMYYGNTCSKQNAAYQVLALVHGM